MARPKEGQEKDCINCGKEFTIGKVVYHLDTGFACSKECFDKYVNKQKKFNEERSKYGR